MKLSSFSELTFMKKNHCLIFYFLFSTLSVFFYACRKDANSKPQNPIESVPLKQAKEIFGLASSEIQQRFKTQYNELKPKWDIAAPVSLGVKNNALYVPLAYDTTTGNYLHLIIMKDEGRVRSLLVEMQPDPIWLKDNRELSEYNSLTGKLIFYSVNGRFYQGYDMENGSMKKEYTPNSELNNINSLLGLNGRIAASSTSGNGDPCVWGQFGCQELAEVVVTAVRTNTTNYVNIYIPASVYNSNPAGGYYNGYSWYPTYMASGTYSKPSATQLKSQIAFKPFALFDIPCSVIQAWINTIKTRVAAAELNKLKQIAQTTATGPGISLTTVAYLQNIDNAYSTIVNMDYFPITIDKLPKINNRTVTPNEFLSYIRLNINSFVNTSLSNFTPYNHLGTNDTQLWNSPNPTGAVVAIDINGGLEDGSVIVSNYSAMSWTFSTIYDPIYGSHPVSGHREFGYTVNANGSYTFYTRGVDRLTNIDGTFLQTAFQIPFNKADELWTSFQSKITDFVKANGGTATRAIPEINRPNWQKVKDVVDGKAPLNSLSKDCPTN